MTRPSRQLDALDARLAVDADGICAQDDLAPLAFDRTFQKQRGGNVELPIHQT